MASLGLIWVYVTTGGGCLKGWWNFKPLGVVKVVCQSLTTDVFLTHPQKASSSGSWNIKHNNSNLRVWACVCLSCYWWNVVRRIFLLFCIMMSGKLWQRQTKGRGVRRQKTHQILRRGGVIVGRLAIQQTRKFNSLRNNSSSKLDGPKSWTGQGRPKRGVQP